MNSETVIFLILSLGFALNFWISHRARKRNKAGKCAKCSCDMTTENNLSVIASGQRYMYCVQCGEGVKLRDRLFMGGFILVAISLLVTAYFFSQ